MPRYRYVALSADGRTITGRIEAADPQGAAAALRAEGRWTVELEPLGGSGAAAAERIRDAEFGLIARELSTLLQAGAPVDRALAMLIDLAPSKRAAGFIRRALERVRGGAALSDALEGAGLDPAGGRIGLIRAGEAAGESAAALDRLATAIERSEALRAAVRSALVYPAVVVAAALGAILLLALFVLPRFEEIFLSAGAEMPGAAGALLAATRWAGAHGAALIGGAVAAVVAGWVVARSEAGALALSRLAVGAPVIGPILRALDAARFCRTLGLMLAGGAPAVEAAGGAVSAMGRRAMRAQASGFAADLGAGQGLGAAMARTGAFPKLAVSLARVGEESGAAPAMLAHAAQLFEAQAERAARRAVQLIAPAATLLLGGLVALIVVSMMTAMLSLNEVI